jgi:peptidase E
MSFIFSDKKYQENIISQLRNQISKTVKEDYVVLGFMPATRAKRNRYTFFVKSICQRCGYEFVYLDNQLEGDDAKKELKKLDMCNVLLISGGNTYELLRNLRISGFDKKIVEFSERDDTVVVGFSAGAIVLGTTLRLLEYRWEGLRDSNTVSIKDISGLGIIDKEIFPHYTDGDKEDLDKYIKKFNTEVITLKDDEFLVV